MNYVELRRENEIKFLNFHNEKFIKFLFSLAVCVIKIWLTSEIVLGFNDSNFETSRVSSFVFVRMLTEFTILIFSIFSTGCQVSIWFSFSRLTFFCFINHKVNSSILKICCSYFSRQFSENCIFLIPLGIATLDDKIVKWHISTSLRPYKFVFPSHNSYNSRDQIQWYAILLKPVN